jgi:hypothetical protein
MRLQNDSAYNESFNFTMMTSTHTIIMPCIYECLQGLNFWLKMQALPFHCSYGLVPYFHINKYFVTLKRNGHY